MAVREVVPATVEEELLVRVLSSEEALVIDEVIRRSELPPSVVLSSLIALEMKGLVESAEGGLWALMQ